MQHLRGWCTAGLALLLGACAAGSVSEHRSAFYAPHLVQYAAREGSFPVVVRGNPTGLSKNAADAAIAELLRLPSWATPARFAPVDRAEGLYYVLIFDPARRVASGSSACASAETLPLASSGGETAVLGVFCQANEALSAALAVGPAVRGADDPGLRSLLASVTGRVFAYIFPARQGSVF